MRSTDIKTSYRRDVENMTPEERWNSFVGIWARGVIKAAEQNPELMERLRREDTAGILDNHAA